MNLRHLKQVPDDRKAIAPYNFVELPNKVVPAQVECNGKLRDNDRYYSDRHTGKIICTLKTESPLYIRCGLNPVDFATFGDTSNEDLTPEQRKKKAEFFLHPANNLHPVLPGSSLRGMLRTLVEIISFGKIERVSDQQKFFFRAVAAESDDPLSKLYKDRLKNVKAGYLVETKEGWFIRPVSQTVNGKTLTFVLVQEDRGEKREPGEQDIKTIATHFAPIFITFNQTGYVPQYQEVSFETTYTKNGRIFAKNISADREQFKYKGVIVTSGNMKHEGNTTASPRQNHCIVLEVKDTNFSRSLNTDIKIDIEAVRYYRNSLTDFQKQIPFNEKMGMLHKGRPVFYCEAEVDTPVTLFGQSPNFRVPYSPKNDGQAASAADFIPKEVGESDLIDLADAIFGFVRGKKDKTEADTTENSKEKREKSRAGRIFVSDAKYKTDEDGIWLTDDTITPQILASPKPTTFQHYLVQPEDTQAAKIKLKHYGKPITETVIRGHKLYWHKGNVSQERIKADATEAEIEQKQSQYTEIKPIKAGVDFEFKIHFENLSDVELGALLWILTLAGDDTEKLKMINLDGKEKYRLSLGMGKPLGMGAVVIEYKLVLNERYKNDPEQRYTKLFDGDKWLTGDNCKDTTDKQKHCFDKFEQYIVNNISIKDCPQGFLNTENRDNLNLKDIPRIRMLLAMLSWNFPPLSETRYMEIERTQQPRLGDDENEYKERRVLPTPFQLMNRLNEDNRQLHHSPAPSNPSSQNQGNGGNRNAATQRPPKPPKR
ncbi:TIGR03986 family type III CRISPR-associated RAMP protein [Limnofasciculus baicalensis]|uniref:TIGR03986 family CRISPR-associated RAMP protein n=1 Tax=Limnofasciculus baicalensis BBK-W-15 TaxID=2699891 RepID=A0AAE3GNI4_9CYAN|nr:TIGR03986 family CRISPR-associated RAMP protein [Limnofasciculus baicalensis]MCP2727179.1 TIGR03986 family CRISPR-associated RAMP protein [Limnofasciculus baicalensis BBK-W-15]